jgi:hypothetical protein
MNTSHDALRGTPAASADPTPQRLVVTAVGDDGRAVVARDERLAPNAAPSPSRGWLLWGWDEIGTLPLDPQPRLGPGPYPAPGGALLKVTEVAPRSSGVEVPMHRSDTVDFGFVLSGEITLIMDGGDEATLGPGDVVVQLGTCHSWEVRGDEPCRVAFVFIGHERAPEPS